MKDKNAVSQPSLGLPWEIAQTGEWDIPELIPKTMRKYFCILRVRRKE